MCTGAIYRAPADFGRRINDHNTTPCQSRPQIIGQSVRLGHACIQPGIIGSNHTMGIWPFQNLVAGAHEYLCILSICTIAGIDPTRIA